MMTEEEARGRVRSIMELSLYGCYFVDTLTLAQFAAACNGIGPESWPEERRQKLDKWLAMFRLAADVHDCRFTWNNDGSREKFDYANDELEKNCKLLADEKYSWWNPLRYFARNRAHLISEACRVFGWDAWIKAYHKAQEMDR